MRILIILILTFLPVGRLWGAPDCYERAALPAHKSPFAPLAETAEVVGLTWDGAGCQTITFWRGAPLFEQKIYAPFRLVYEAYAQALAERNPAALRHIYARLRPTPRDFVQWVELFSVNEGPPGGMAGALDIVRFLQPYPRFINQLLLGGDPDLPALNMPRAWPALFLLMGGEVRPAADWTQRPAERLSTVSITLWHRYPFYGVEDDGSSSLMADGPLRLR